MNAIAKNMIPHFVLLPIPNFLLISGTIGMETKMPKPKQKRAVPISASFSVSFDLINGRYNTHVPVRILIDANTQHGAKYLRSDNISLREFINHLKSTK